jgi:hypothetical protein
MMHRQQTYQQEHEDKGLCRQCPCPAEGLFCTACRDKERTRARNRYRTKHGIPLNAPIRRTRPRA